MSVYPSLKIGGGFLFLKGKGTKLIMGTYADFKV